MTNINEYNTKANEKYSKREESRSFERKVKNFKDCILSFFRMDKLSKLLIGETKKERRIRMDTKLPKINIKKETIEDFQREFRKMLEERKQGVVRRKRYGL
jgi:hypothetical protein